MNTPYLTVPEVAQRWRLKERSVRQEIGRGNLRAIKVGGQWLITPADVEAFEATRVNVRPVPKRTRAPKRRAS